MSLLIHEPPLQVLPSLAVAIGLNEAIVLQQIHYWLSRSTTVVNGEVWVYNTVNQWREQFPFWSDDTIARALKSLREREIVIAEKLSQDAFNKTLFYRINYSNVPSSIPASCGNRSTQHAGFMNTASCGNRSTQNASLSNKTETTNIDSETTDIEKPAQKRGRQQKSKVIVSREQMLEMGIDATDLDCWLAKRGSRHPVTINVIEDLKAEAAKAGLSVPTAVKYTSKKSWIAFNAAYYANAEGVGQKRQAGSSLQPATGQVSFFQITKPDDF